LKNCTAQIIRTRNCTLERFENSESSLHSFGQNQPIKNYDSFPNDVHGILTNSADVKGNKILTKNSQKMIGLITEEERKVKVQRYLEKKKRRKGENSVRYECRQDLASRRFRFQGRFIKFEDLHKFKGKYIIDYTGRKLIKPIFLIEKEKSRC